MVEIKKYDRDFVLPSDIAKQVARVFRENYPSAHTPENRDEDITKRDSQEALNALLSDGRVIFTAQDVHDNVIGLIEIREYDHGDGVYIQLVWIIVDALSRGAGVSSELHRAFYEEAKKRASVLPKPSCLLLSVHQDNPAISVYEKWGYTRGELTDDDKIFMYKDL